MGAIAGHHQLMMIAAAGGGLGPICTKLTGWWEMDEASGTRTDSVGSNPLTVAGTVTTAAGSRGTDTAASFAGAGTLWANATTALQIPSGGGEHCLFGWFYLTSNAGVNWLAGRWNGFSSAALEYATSVQSSVIYGQNGGASYTNASTTAPAINTWHFVVVWRDSTDGKVRVQVNNGTVFVSSAASNPAPTSWDLTFGRYHSATSGTGTATGGITGRLQRWGWIKGAILTSTERTYLYNAGTGRTYAELLAAGA